jgi:hypothetical protein
MRTTRFLIFTLLALTLPARLLAWGPHSEITQAAMDTLPPDDPLVRELGDAFGKLHDYCWMADWRRQLHREAGAWFYVDDYLLFPSMITHRDHLCPEVKQTYNPFFRRALQALRTESPVNAARWIGAILHFTEDTGSPPHAAEIRGDVHSKMENWVEAKAIHLPGYQPRMLGETDDEAVAGFLKRMDGLIAFSKERAERARPFVVSGDRASTEPIVLESALETSRVAADLLFTLGHLAEHGAPDAASVGGAIASTAAPGLELIPAKVALLGTTISTLADSHGRYEFHGLPPGQYRFAVLRAGSAVAVETVSLSAGEHATRDLALPPESEPENMLRNGSFQLTWLSDQQTDAWYPVRRRSEPVHWEGELVPLVAGAKYRLRVKWREGSSGQVVLRLLGAQTYGTLPSDSNPLQRGDAELLFSATKETAYAQILVYGDGLPGSVAETIALTPAP